MKLVILKTNLDQYQDMNWPVLYDMIIPVGTMVSVGVASIDLCKSRGIPTELVVTSVSINETGNVVVGLWFSKTQMDVAKINGTWDKLMGQ